MVNLKLRELEELSKQVSDKTFNYLVDKFKADLKLVIEQNNHSNYLLLPQTREHPDLIVSLNKLSYGPEVVAIEIGRASCRERV